MLASIAADHERTLVFLYRYFIICHKPNLGKINKYVVLPKKGKMSVVNLLLRKADYALLESKFEDVSKQLSTKEEKN